MPATIAGTQDRREPPVSDDGRPGKPDHGFSVGESEEILFSLALAVEQRDHHTAAHCGRLAWISVGMGIAMGLARSSLSALYRGGYLHDVGKVGIPDSILFKPGGLTPDEWVVMRSHAPRGEEICRPMKALAPVLPIIRHHHERWDGSGYPDGLCGEQIPLLARILQIADIYDSLTSPRPYKPAFSDEKALSIIAEETERGWRDPAIVELFMRLHKERIFRADEPSAGIRGSLANLQQMVTPKFSAPLLPVFD
ncbi:MAG TPA: HD domain-containing phosphohydrolase [Bryobacteraceae bacterium]